MIDIDIRYVGGKGGKMWTVQKEIVHVLHDGTTIIIPIGFKTDLSSVPKFLWGIMPPFGDFLLAALVHDYLYIIDQTRGRKFADKEMVIISKKLNNETIFNRLDNQIRYIGVRAFGWYYWEYKDL